MAKSVKLGSAYLVDADIAFAGGADFFESFHYEAISDCGRLESVDISSWDAFMGFARRGKLVLQCDECLSTDENGYVRVHIPAATTSKLPIGVYDYNIVLRDGNGAVISFVGGEANVSKIIPVVPEKGE